MIVYDPFYGIIIWSEKKNCDRLLHLLKVNALKSQFLVAFNSLYVVGWLILNRIW